ncbi:thioredoxin domain-containing protein [Sediminimonas sp.]|uniref:thioredoxin family protein n=1 Tax=Sediminimonas sp. TaxID=2823379 RepID=UPI0025CD4AE0|nr:thioredoxin domain-containing protein [Sediminimonas sp.]
MATLKLTCLSCGQVNRVQTARLGAGPKCGTCGAPLMKAKPVEVDLATLQKAARTDDVPLVVDFWAPWCGPCRMMAPEFAKAAAELSGQARLAKINTQDHPRAGSVYNIRGIPTMVRFARGRETARQSGALQAPQIVAWAQAGAGAAAG